MAALGSWRTTWPTPSALTSRKRDVDPRACPAAALDESSPRLEAWLAADSRRPAEQAERTRSCCPLAEALALLPEASARPLVLQHWQAGPLAEIGEHPRLDDRRGAGLLHRGLSDLREHCTENGSEAMNPRSDAPPGTDRATKADPAAYLAGGVRRGQTPTGTECSVARHPDLAVRAWRRFFADQDAVRSASQPAAGPRCAPGPDADRCADAGLADASPEPPRVRRSATTSCWRRSPAAAWASSTRPGRSASTASSPSR